MSNPAKRKGDHFEREAVRSLVQVAPDLVIAGARRKLGAGRHDDVGDIDAIAGVTIQVRALRDVSKALRSAANDASKQGKNAQTDWSIGLVPILRARPGTPRWIVSTLHWPGDPCTPPKTVSRTADAVKLLRSAGLESPIVVVDRAGQELMYVSTLETWVSSIRTKFTHSSMYGR